MSGCRRGPEDGRRQRASAAERFYLKSSAERANARLSRMTDENDKVTDCSGPESSISSDDNCRSITSPDLRTTGSVDLSDQRSSSLPILTSYYIDNYVRRTEDQSISANVISTNTDIATNFQRLDLTSSLEYTLLLDIHGDNK